MAEQVNGFSPSSGEREVQGLVSWDSSNTSEWYIDGGNVCRGRDRAKSGREEKKMYRNRETEVEAEIHKGKTKTQRHIDTEITWRSRCTQKPEQ